MADDSYTEVTNQSWFSRIGNAVKGMLFGCVLFLIAFPLLFWNEGRSVKTYNTLVEGGRIVVSANSDTVNAGNAGTLVHVTGKADTQDTVRDDLFGVTAKALRLNRVVEMYQWKESKESKTEKKTGGGTTTSTTYSYGKTWSEHAIDSSEFKKADDHRNPGPMPFGSAGFFAGKVTLGAFTLTRSLVEMIGDFTPLPVTSNTPVPDALGTKGKHYNSGFYVGADPATPQIGDVRIAFKSVQPMDVSVIARQVNDTFEPYAAKAGGTIELLQTGIHSAEAMFQKAQASNRMLTWLLRLAGLALMFFGLSMVFKPLSVVADVLPIAGTLVGMGTGVVAFLLAACLSLCTIAVAWIVYRPVLGIALLAVAAGVAVVLWKKARHSKSA